MNDPMFNSKTWRELYEEALSEALHAHEDSTPEKQEFLQTFKNFYDDLKMDCRISSYPVDPPGSRRMAVSRATVVWADDIAN